jgi:methyl-accepting chemotaxis protein
MQAALNIWRGTKQRAAGWVAKLSHPGIAGRLTLGFAVLCIGTLFAAGAGWVGIERQSDLANRVVDEDVEFALAVANIRVAVQALRGFEKDMLAHVADQAEADKYRQQWDDTRGRLDELVSQAHLSASSDAERASLERLAGSILIYDGGIQVLNAEIAEGKITTPAQGYQRIAEFAQGIRGTESAAAELLEGANRRIDALKPALAANTQQVVTLLAAVTTLAVVLAALIGVLASRSVTVPVARAVRLAEQLARGDLTTQIESSGSDELARLMQALRGTVVQLASIIGRIKQTSDMVGTASRELAQGNTDLSARTEEQASALEETSASMQQMTATVAQNAANARSASELATQVSDTAGRGGEAMGMVVATMAGISESSKKIADIIGVIDGIAFQTNILALNAAVEAARAGEHGRGFAVVASEVRSLAQRSATASKEIRGLIADAVSRTQSGSRQVEEAGSTIAEMVASVKKVTGLIAEITAASQEQASGIEQVSETMTRLEKVTQQNAAMVEQASAAAASLEEQSRALTGAVSVFRLSEEHAAAAPAAEAAQSNPPAESTPPAPAQRRAEGQRSRTRAPAAQVATGRKKASGGLLERGLPTF